MLTSHEQAPPPAAAPWLIRALMLSALMLFPVFDAAAQSRPTRPLTPEPTPTQIPTAPAQGDQPARQANQGEAAANRQKAEAVIRRAVEAMGGARYTGLRTLSGSGLFTTYEGGVPGLPYRFDDYVLFPDKNRTEFRGRGDRIIQTRTPDAGWDYSLAARKIDDAKTAQLADYRFALRTSLDALLRGEWRKPGERAAELSYLGRREAGVGQRNEAVRLTYADGFTVDFEFSARDGLPAKASYRRDRLKENENGIEVPTIGTEEDRFAQFVETGGVRLPFIVDHFRDGVQTSRVNYETITPDAPISDSFFRRPANVKELTERKKD